MLTGPEEAFKHALQALAQPADYQLRLLHRWREDASELPERAAHAHRNLTVRLGWPLTDRQEATVSALLAKFAACSGPQHTGLWRDWALEQAPYWADVRLLARGCLEAFGWPDECPPLNIEAYGDDHRVGRHDR